MAPVFQTTYSEGIFHGLPTFPSHSDKKYTAIVTGANGISGAEIVNVLAAAPERWSTIYAMSRRPPQSSNPRVKPIAADFLSSTPDELATLFKNEGIKADYIFFTSYMQPAAPEGAALWSNTEDLDAVNVKLLSNFLTALTISHIIPKRFVLQTGGKHYALHLGPTAIPMTEDTPEQRVPHSNFYFPQEDLLFTWAGTHHTAWTVTRPGFIIGANPSAAINLVYGLAIYASVQRYLGRSLAFPADIAAWDANKDLTSARLLGYFSEWAALTDAAADQALNIVDDSPFAYGKFWPELARWYGIEPGRPEPDGGQYATITMPRDPPPRGFGPPGEVHAAFSFGGWAQRAEVKDAWEKIQAEQGLRREVDPWGSPQKVAEVFGTLDSELLGGWARTQTMDKAKRMGWQGHVQSDEGIRDAIERMVEMRMVPNFSA